MNFPYPTLSFNALTRVNPFEFLDKLFIPKTKFLALSVGEDFVILAFVVCTQYQRVMDGQTDRQTDIPIVANTGLACYQVLILYV